MSELNVSTTQELESAILVDFQAELAEELSPVEVTETAEQPNNKIWIWGTVGLSSAVLGFLLIQGMLVAGTVNHSTKCEVARIDSSKNAQIDQIYGKLSKLTGKNYEDSFKFIPDTSGCNP
jgi:hypothetical protein